VVSGNIAFGVSDKDTIAEPGTLVHLPAGTMHWFRYGQGGGEIISMTSREAASHFFTDLDRAISPEAPDIHKCRNRHPAPFGACNAKCQSRGVVKTSPICAISPQSNWWKGRAPYQHAESAVA
jgi:hypothetical protein